MEAEDVADLQQPSGLPHEIGEPTALVDRDGERLLDEAVAAGPETLAREGKMVVGGRHDVDRVDVR
jgi:hypothetical protein